MNRVKNIILWSGRIWKAEMMFAFGVLLLMLSQLRWHTQYRRKWEVFSSVYCTYETGSPQISLFWRAQGFPSKGTGMGHLSETLRRQESYYQWKEVIINLVFTLKSIM